ncbi:hypothetical protein AB0C84_35885 [Actinomadura sp. NPDC048955]|uniref:hypothetical protein n=1 Tax=Actinomadura sp. NPDC048955 TaxID=3158228 RepID=UPI0033FDFCE3
MAPGLPIHLQVLADALWRDVLTLVEAVQACQESRDIDADTVETVASDARRGLAELVVRAQRPSDAETAQRPHLPGAVTGPVLAADRATIPRADPDERKGTSGAVTREEDTGRGGDQGEQEAPDGPIPSGALRTVKVLGKEWATDEDDVLWWQGTTRVGSVVKAWPGSGGQARHSTGRRVTTGAGPKDRYRSRIKALAALAAEYDRARRERTPHAEVPIEGLPDGWRLTQTLAEHDDGRWTQHAPGGQIAGTITRVDYGGSRPEWRATAGDPSLSTSLRITVTPDADHPARGSDFDLFRTRTAAAHALAAWHDPDLHDL